MATYGTKTIFHVYKVEHLTIDNKPDKLSLIWIHDLYQYNGHSSYSDAKQWIERLDDSGEYTILEVFKKV